MFPQDPDVMCFPAPDFDSSDPIGDAGSMSANDAGETDAFGNYMPENCHCLCFLHPPDESMVRPRECYCVPAPKSYTDEPASSYNTNPLTPRGYVDLHLNHLWPQTLEWATIQNGHFGVVLPKLRALLPQRMYLQEAGIACLSTGSEEYSRAYLRLLEISLANGYAGLDNLPSKTILEYLQHRFPTLSISEFSESLGRTGSRSFCESLLKGAIKASQPHVVDFLLSTTTLGLDVNRNVIMLQMERLTLVEYAAYNLDIDVTQVLLKHRADITRTFEGQEALLRLVQGRGALLSRFRWQETFRKTYDGRAIPWTLVNLCELPDDQNFCRLGCVLLEAGARVQEEVLEILLESEITGLVSDFIESVIRHGISDCRGAWLRSGCLSQSLEVLHSESAVRIATMLITAGTDLNVDPSGRRAGIYLNANLSGLRAKFHPRRLIDAAAKTGNLTLFKMLHECGATYTEWTFEIAVGSGNHDLIQYLILEGAVKPPSHDIWIEMIDALHGGGPELACILQNNIHNPSAYDREIVCAAVYDASRAGDMDRLCDLIDSPTLEGMRITQRSSRARSKVLEQALNVAILEEHEHLIPTLIRAGAYVPNALSNAFKKGSRRLICKMIGAATELYMEIFEIDATRSGRDPDWEKFLLFAVEWGDQDLVQRIIDVGVDVDHYDLASHMTAVGIAVTAKDLAMTKILLESGANANAPFEIRRITPLSRAVENNDLDMISLLLEFGAEPLDPVVISEALKQRPGLFKFLIREYGKRQFSNDQKSKAAVVDEPIEQHEIGTLRQLLKQRSPLQRGRSKPLLNIACEADQPVRLEFASLLLESGADPNEVFLYANRRHEEATALLKAIKSRDVDIVMLLIKFGADVNLPARNGVRRTPLQMSVEQGSFELALLLLQNGARANDDPAYGGGATSLQLAAIGGYVGIAELLIENGADVNAPGAMVDGRTAIEGAAEHGRLSMMGFLLELGVNVDPKGHGSECVTIQLARKNGHLVIAELLEAHLGLNIQQEVERGQTIASQSTLPIADLMDFPGEDTGDELQVAEKSDDESEGGFPTEPQTNDSRSNLVCQHCQKLLSCPYALKRHIRTKHSEGPRYSCKFCSQRFTRPDVLSRHVKSHTDAGKVPCRGCGKSFRKDYLHGYHLDSNGNCKKMGGME